MNESKILEMETKLNGIATDARHAFFRYKGDLSGWLILKKKAVVDAEKNLTCYRYDNYKTVYQSK